MLALVAVNGICSETQSSIYIALDDIALINQPKAVPTSRWNRAQVDGSSTRPLYGRVDSLPSEPHIASHIYKYIGAGHKICCHGLGKYLHFHLIGKKITKDQRWQWVIGQMGH